MYTSYVLSDKSRNQLLEQFPPKFSKVVCHHVTKKYPVPQGTEAPAMPKSVKVVGHVVDPNGLECLVVSVDGSTKREDGGTYHVTHSLDPNKYKPVDSNRIIGEFNQTKLKTPIEVSVTPTVGN